MCRRRNGQGEAENSTPQLARCKPEKTTMLLNHGAAQAQPQAHALGFGGEKRREQLRGHICRNSFALVCH